MSMEILGGIIVVLFITVVVLVVLLIASRRKTGGDTGELVQLKAELEHLNQSLVEKDAQFNSRLNDRDEMCDKLLAEKETSCQKILAEKEAAFRQKQEACDVALAEKDAACRKLLAEKDKACAETIAAKQTACNQIISEKNAALVQKEHDCRASLKDKDEAIARLIKEVEQKFGETVKGLQEHFGNIAATKMNEQQTNLSALNKVQMEQVVKPLHDQLHQLQLLTQQAQDGNISLEKSMGEHIEAIGKIATGLSDVATKLTSNTRYQGRKGEEILAEKLRQAGLEENVNFFLQTGNDSDRPDAQVCDTENRWLIIDSKVSLTAYMEYMDAKDETVKAEKLQTHVTSVRQKIDQLAKKKYPKVFSEEHKDRNYLPITAMFVPYEAPLMAALQAEPSLWQFAAQNNVILITPLTLMAYLRLVYLAWQHEKEARNQQAIVDTARELLKRTNDFLKTFEELGGSMVQLQKVYEKSKGLLVDAAGAHTIAKSAKKLIDLHVKLESKKGKRIEKAECLKDIDEDDVVEVSALEDNSGAPEQASDKENG